MKILILFGKWPGGVGVVMQNIAKELEEKDHKVELVSRAEDLKIKSFIGSIGKIRKFVKDKEKKEKYDIIYTNDWSLALPLLFPFPLFKKKHYCCFHGIQLGKLAGILQKITGKIMGKNLVVIGDSLKEMFPESNLIFNGARLDLFKPIEEITRIKDSVGFANWKLPEYNYEEIKKAVEETGKKFIVAEGIKYEKMPEFYNSVETFISLPPLETSCAMVWLEAVACGVPRIIGNAAGIRFPINYIEDFPSIQDSLVNAKTKDYSKFPYEKFTWKTHASQLLRLWEGNEIEVY